MTKEIMYNELAKYYDLLYSWKDYKKESNEVLKVIKKFKRNNGKKLLDVACGSGKHLEYFQKIYRCTGTDINKGILNEAKKRLPKITFKVADMRRFNMHEKYDVVTCLFSSIGYVTDIKGLKNSIKNFSEHLNTGGVLLIEPWIEKKTWETRSNHMTTYNSEDIKIARLHVAERKGNLSIMNFHYLIADKDKIIYKIDKNVMLLLTHKELISLMRKNGLKTYKYTKGEFSGRALLVGVKP